jgi:hypothetical protein
VAVVTEPPAGLDGDQVETDREASLVVRWRGLEPAEGGSVEPSPLGVVDRLLRQSEAAACSPANLDEHERARWSRIDGNQVDLGPAHADLASEDLPANRRQAIGDQGLGGVTQALRGRSHRPILRSSGCPSVIGG